MLHQSSASNDHYPAPVRLDYDITVLRLPEGAGAWELVGSYLRFRKQVFIDQKDWQLYQSDGIEFEQYDTLTTVYVIAHRNGALLGGARLRRTDDTNGVYSYMIRDAHLGLLAGMPEDLCDAPPPVDHSVWELTRLATLPSEPTVAPALLRASNDFLHGLTATSCLFLGSPAFMRMARRLGWAPEPLGKIVGNDDGRFIAFRCAIIPPLTQPRAPSEYHA